MAWFRVILLQKLRYVKWWYFFVWVKVDFWLKGLLILWFFYLKVSIPSLILKKWSHFNGILFATYLYLISHQLYQPGLLALTQGVYLLITIDYLLGMNYFWIFMTCVVTSILEDTLMWSCEPFLACSSQLLVHWMCLRQLLLGNVWKIILFHH